jgi:hypothetical protein
MYEYETYRSRSAELIERAARERRASRARKRARQGAGRATRSRPQPGNPLRGHFARAA